MLRRNATKTKAVDDERSIVFLLSDETKDRHNSIIKSDGWDLENYNKNPIVAYQHKVGPDVFNDPNPDLIIGRGSVWLEDGKLWGKIDFEDKDNNPLAEKIYNKIKNGFLSAVSVGFTPIEDGRGDEKRGEDPEVYYFRKQELAEFSVVNIPSNPNAVKRFKEYISKNSTVEVHKDKGLKGLTKARFFKLNNK